MNIKVLILICLIIVSCSGRNKKQSNNENVKETEFKILEIKGDVKNLLQIDSIFDDVTTIPLETNNNCLISYIEKAIIHKEKVVIKDSNKKIYVFNIEGKFLNEIGREGKGPGEYFNLRDISIDLAGNVYLLDYGRILQFQIDGKFIQSHKFLFAETNNILCVPQSFAKIQNGNYLIWGGSTAIKENLTKNLYAMYESTKDGKILNGYFPVKHNIPGSYTRFSQYKDLIILEPVFGSNVIYSINSEGELKQRYDINFGNKTLTIQVPEGFSSLVDFTASIDEKFYHSLSRFTETSDWLFFTFVFRRELYNVYFSKRLNKSFISRQWPLVSGRIAPWIIHVGNNDSLFSFSDPQYVIDQIAKCKSLNPEDLSETVKRNLNTLNHIKPSDNPILFICSMKKY